MKILKEKMLQSQTSFWFVLKFITQMKERKKKKSLSLIFSHVRD